jgi:hypothetical protein
MASSPVSRQAEVADLLAKVRASKAKRLLKHGVMSGSVALVGVQGLAACGEGTTDEESGDDSAISPNVPAPGVDPGKSDWAQGEGERRTDMVQYRGEFFTEFSDCNTRAGCMGMDLILKVFAKPQAGANLDAKKVGAVYRFPDWEGGRTETGIGTYFATDDDGWEEWHVRIKIRKDSTTNQPIAVFNAWYQDGLNHTYFDDNKGEFHVAAGRSPITHYMPYEGVQVSDQGVKGALELSVADLDFDKQIELVSTIDGWQTVSVFGIGDGANKWRWVGDGWGGVDRFRIDVDIAGATDRFEYAVVYRHGVVNDATPYEYWANGGGSNYVVTRTTQP